MKKIKSKFLRWSGAILFLLVLCSNFPGQCMGNGKDEPKLPACKEYGSVDIHFFHIALRFNHTNLNPSDREFFEIYHNIRENDDVIDDLFDLINTTEYNILTEKSRSYIDITLTSPDCSGAVRQHYSKPEEIAVNTLRQVKSMEFPPKKISYVIKTGLSWNKNRIGWSITKDYAILDDLTSEGEFTSENTFSVPDVTIPGLMMKEISIDDPDFPVAPGTGIWTGGDPDFGKEIIMH